jgi:hypothetical protein
MLKIKWPVWLPVVGGLGYCGVVDHWKASQKVTFELLFATFPLTLGAIVIWLSGAAPGFGTALEITLWNGDLYIYSTALLAPIFWLAIVEYAGERHFPNKKALLALIVIVNSISALLFGFLRGGRSVVMQKVFSLSAVLFLISLCLLYLGTVYHYSLSRDPAKEFKDAENRVLGELQGRSL